MTYINQDSKSWFSYLTMLRNRVHKIMPLIEEENEGVFRYIDSLLFDLYGMRYVIEDLEDSGFYVNLMGALESMLDETIVKEKDFSFIRSKILGLTGDIERLRNKEVRL